MPKVSRGLQFVGALLRFLSKPLRQVLASILGQFSWPVLIGLAAGIGGTAALSQILRRVLYGVRNLDPLSYTTAIALLIAIFSLAAILPARVLEAGRGPRFASRVVSPIHSVLRKVE
jgi:hypothetical protein